MRRHKRLVIKKKSGRPEYYSISTVDTFNNNSILTTYMPQAGERYDNIAFNFYGDSKLWYVIARANKDVKGTLMPTPNKILVIPRI